MTNKPNNLIDSRAAFTDTVPPPKTAPFDETRFKKVLIALPHEVYGFFEGMAKVRNSTMDLDICEVLTRFVAYKKKV
jgi:hypothetical protein